MSENLGFWWFSRTNEGLPTLTNGEVHYLLQPGRDNDTGADRRPTIPDLSLLDNQLRGGRAVVDGRVEAAFHGMEHDNRLDQDQLREHLVDLRAELREP